LDLRLVVSSRLLCGLAVHIRALRLLCFLYHTCMMWRDWPLYAFMLRYGTSTSDAFVLLIGLFSLLLTHIVVSLSVELGMSGKLIWYLSDGQSYCRNCCTITEKKSSSTNSLIESVCAIFVPTYSVDSHFAVIGRALPLGLQHDVYGAVRDATCLRKSPAWLSTQWQLGSYFLLCASCLGS